MNERSLFVVTVTSSDEHFGHLFIEAGIFFVFIINDKNFYTNRLSFTNKLMTFCINIYVISYNNVVG